MIEFVVRDTCPTVLVVTPLKPGDSISEDTFKSISGSHTPIHWISFQCDQNPYKNFDTALKLYDKSYHIPKYIIKMDNDIDADKNMIGCMVESLDKSNDNIAYTYCSFKFVGSINAYFPAIPFDSRRLLRANYISSMSMMKSSHLHQIGGVETSDKYFRLLDWVLWLKFLKNGFIGVPTTDTTFVANAGKSSISARGPRDYMRKAQQVYNDFIVPILISSPNK